MIASKATRGPAHQQRTSRQRMTPRRRPSGNRKSQILPEPTASTREVGKEIAMEMWPISELKPDVHFDPPAEKALGALADFARDGGKFPPVQILPNGRVLYPRAIAEATRLLGRRQISVWVRRDLVGDESRAPNPAHENRELKELAARLNRGRYKRSAKPQVSRTINNYVQKMMDEHEEACSFFCFSRAFARIQRLRAERGTPKLGGVITHKDNAKQWPITDLKLHAVDSHFPQLPEKAVRALVRYVRAGRSLAPIEVLPDGQVVGSRAVFQAIRRAGGRQIWVWIRYDLVRDESRTSARLAEDNRAVSELAARLEKVGKGRSAKRQAMRAIDEFMEMVFDYQRNNRVSTLSHMFMGPASFHFSESDAD